MTYAADLPDGSVVTPKAYIFHGNHEVDFSKCLLKSPCDLDARKSFPNAPDYELKLNSGLIVHLAAVRSGEGKIDVGITYTDVHQVQCCTTPRFAHRALVYARPRATSAR